MTKKFSYWFKKIKNVKETSYKFSSISKELINELLKEIKQKLLFNKTNIMNANLRDIKLAKSLKLSEAIIDRLTLTEKRFQEMITGIETVISLESPVDVVIKEWKRVLPSGEIVIKKVTVPLGVILVIYESRPNVTIDASILCLKANNCVILRGGSETVNTNKELVKSINMAVEEVWSKFKLDFPKDIVVFVEDTSYELLYKILKLDKYIDLVIPRGGEKMVNTIKEKSLIPVLSHGSGVCHTYVDKAADVEIALKVCFNAKVQRPSVCNAMETLLVHKDIAEEFLPKMAKIYIENNVEIRGCLQTYNLLKRHNIKIKKAKKSDFGKEFLDYIIAIKIVNSIDEAISHINSYGSHHSDAIISKDITAQEKFKKEVDSSAIFINSSTRLHDGGVFGFGSEIGISTSKLHARGTMGVNELVTTKYIVSGYGVIRE